MGRGYTVKYELKRRAWTRHQRRVWAHSWGEKKTAWADEVRPHSLKNVDGGEKQERDRHQQRDQLEGKKLEERTDSFFVVVVVSKVSRCTKNKSVDPRLSLSPPSYFTRHTV